MTELFASFSNYAINLPWLELVAMLLALAYILWAAVGSIWCWPAAFVSTAIYTYIFYDVLLLMESALNIYYLVMAVYGYWSWQKDASINNTEIPSLIGRKTTANKLNGILVMLIQGTAIKFAGNETNGN